jgi:hypothetical protein
MAFPSAYTVLNPDIVSMSNAQQKKKATPSSLRAKNVLFIQERQQKLGRQPSGVVEGHVPWEGVALHVTQDRV